MRPGRTGAARRPEDAFVQLDAAYYQVEAVTQDLSALADALRAALPKKLARALASPIDALGRALMAVLDERVEPLQAAIRARARTVDDGAADGAAQRLAGWKTR